MLKKKEKEIEVNNIKCAALSSIYSYISKLTQMNLEQNNNKNQNSFIHFNSFIHCLFIDPYNTICVNYYSYITSVFNCNGRIETERTSEREKHFFQFLFFLIFFNF
jgi:hypothetical protein